MKKILIIEDEEFMREILGDMISVLGYECIKANDGYEGLEFARKHFPDLIISDITMSGLNGFDVLKELRNTPQTTAIPFIFLTGISQWKDQRYGMELGADDFIPKPVTLDELSRAIEIQFNKSEERNKKALKVVDELRYNIARMLPHELRTPLTAIISCLELLNEEYYTLNDEDRLMLILNSYEGAKRLERLIQNILLYVELEVKSKDDNFILESQCSLISNPAIVIRNSVLNAAKSMNRESDVSLDLSDAPIRMFPFHLEKIVYEIIRNAFQFSNVNTRVGLTCKAQNNTFFLKIQDNGKGISEEQIRQIDAFVQFERKIFEQQGAGLGLCIVKMLIEFYDGSFSLQSKPGSGTLVTVGIPLALGLV